MHRRRLLFLLLCWFCLPVLALATEPPKILWRNYDFPPVSILKGPQKGEGYTNIVQHYIMQQLPGYNHESAASNVQRTLWEMKKLPNVCNASLLKTPEREQYVVFTEPVYAVYPVGAIVLTTELDKFRPYLDADGILAFEQLLTSEKFNIGLMKHRVYGGEMQAIIDNFRQSPQAQLYQMSDLLESLLNILLNTGRLDLVLGYPGEMVYLANKLGVAVERLTFLNIVAHEHMIMGYIGCSKSTQGQKIIDEINALMKAGGRDVATKAYLKWLDPQMQRTYLSHDNKQ